MINDKIASVKKNENKINAENEGPSIKLINNIMQKT